MAGNTDGRRPPGAHRGSGMKAPEAAGGKTGHACFSGALAALLLAAAALLLAPGEARAQGCGGAYSVSVDISLTCDNRGRSQVRFLGNGAASITVTVPGGSATTISGSTTNPSLSITAADNTVSGDYAIHVGTTGAVTLTSAGRAIGIDMLGSAAGTATVEIGSAVTMGSSSTRIGQHGIRVRGGRDVTITNAGTIYATYEGIDVAQGGAGTLTVTHSGTVNSLNHGIWARTDGTGPMIVTSSGDVTVTNANQQGIRLEAGNNGAMTLTATGGAIMTPAQGIYMESRGTGAVTIRGAAADAETRSGPTITSSTSHGIHVHKSGASATAGDVSITTTGGTITPATTGNFYGIYVQDRAGYTGSVTIDNAASITAYRPIHVDRLGAGAVTVTNSGGTVLSATQPGIFAANVASDASDVTVRVSGGTVRSTGPEQAAVHARNRGTGDVIATITAGSLISRHHAGLFATLGEDENNNAGQIAITQGGTISARTGVLAEVSRESASGETRAAGNQPLIDVTWTGTFAAGTTAQTAPNDDGRFPAIALDATGVERHRGVVAGDLPHRYGQAAGIEARVMDLDALLATMAKGDDPHALMVVEAQRALLDSRDPGEVDPTDSARAALIVSQFREMLKDENFVRRLPADDDVDADDDGQYSDAEIKTYLTADDNDRRTFLRDLLQHGLSDGEKAILEALTTGVDLNALNAALARLPTTGAGIHYYGDAWKDEVRALLGNFNVGDIRVAVNGGSIDSRGDGIRAYYVTPHDDNGGISVEVAEGASVTGGMAGVYVANAGPGLMLERKYTPGFAEGDDPAELVAVTHGEGADAVPLLDQLVTVHGMVTGGTDAAVHLSGGGAVIIEEGGSVRAGSSGVAILVNDPGPALVYINGEVRGEQGGDAAVHLTGGGSVIVGLNGRVQANGAARTIQGGGDAATMVTVTLVTDGIIMYREDAEEAHARMVGVYDPLSVENVHFREHRDGVPTGYSLEPPLPVDDEGRLDASRLPNRPPPCPDDRPRGADGECPPPPGTGPDPGPGMGSPDDPDDPGMDPRPGPGDPGPEAPPPPAFSCAGAMDGRCRLYEALPSMLLAMNGLPSYAERTAAARDGNGVWARVEAARGKWRAKKATTAEGLAYDHRRGSGRAGVDFTVGERVRGGVSAHAVGGSAEMSGVGEVGLKGWGAGVSATWLDGGLYVDAQAAMTVYDVDVRSHTHGRLLKKGVHGAGYALGVDVGNRMPVGGTTFVTPRAGVAWSRVDLSDFTDLETASNPDLRVRVSVADADSVKGRVGVMLEAAAGPGRLFGSLDVERESVNRTEVRVGGETLKTKVRPTAAHLGLGGVFDVDENVRLKATAGYRTSGSGGASGYGGLELQVRF